MVNKDILIKKLENIQKLNEKIVSSLSDDNKDFINKINEIELIKVEILLIKEKILSLENSRSWMYKTILTSIFIAIFSVFLQIKEIVLEKKVRIDISHIHRAGKQDSNVSK